MTAVRAIAPAKLNLTLEVLGRREDGYHDLESVVIHLDLADELELTPSATREISYRDDAGAASRSSLTTSLVAPGTG